MSGDECEPPRCYNCWRYCAPKGADDFYSLCAYHLNYHRIYQPKYLARRKALGETQIVEAVVLAAIPAIVLKEAPSTRQEIPDDDPFIYIPDEVLTNSWVLEESNDDLDVVLNKF